MGSAATTPLRLSRRQLSSVAIGMLILGGALIVTLVLALRAASLLADMIAGAAAVAALVVMIIVKARLRREGLPTDLEEALQRRAELRKAR